MYVHVDVCMMCMCMVHVYGAQHVHGAMICLWCVSSALHCTALCCMHLLYVYVYGEWQVTSVCMTSTKLMCMCMERSVCMCMYMVHGKCMQSPKCMMHVSCVCVWFMSCACA